MEFIKGKSIKAWIGTLGEAKSIHIVEIIDEGLTYCPQIVYRYWLNNKWQYRIDYQSTIEMNIDFAEKFKE
jgi:hypothetical protein